MRKVFLLLLLVLALGCLQGQVEKQDGTTVTVVGPGLDSAVLGKVESSIRGAVLPYSGMVYDSINVTASKQGSAVYLEVMATTSLTEYPDIYSFIYDPATGELTLKGYILEALPPSIRSEAISIALHGADVSRLLESAALYQGQGELMVRRILPETSEKFYLPKTLFSVTWRDYEQGIAVSALVDLEDGKVVETWSVGTGDLNS